MPCILCHLILRGLKALWKETLCKRLSKAMRGFSRGISLKLGSPAGAGQGSDPTGSPPSWGASTETSLPGFWGGGGGRVFGIPKTQG